MNALFSKTYFHAYFAARWIHERFIVNGNARNL